MDKPAFREMVSRLLPGQLPGEHFPCPENPALDRLDRDPQDLGDLLVSQPLARGQDECGPVPLGQLAQRSLEDVYIHLTGRGLRE